MIFMTQNVAYAADLLPWDFWSKSRQVVWEVPRRLGNDLDSSLDAVAQQPVTTEIFQCLAGCGVSNAIQSRNDLCEDRLDPTWCHQNTRTADRSISAFSIG